MLVADSQLMDGIVEPAEQAPGRFRRIETIDPASPRSDMALPAPVIV
jgi:hypothetical protein